MKPATSDRNFTPTSIDAVSESLATAGTAVLAQRVQGQEGVLCVCPRGGIPRTKLATVIRIAREKPPRIRRQEKGATLFIDTLRQAAVAMFPRLGPETFAGLL